MGAYRLSIKPSAVKELDAVGAKRDLRRIVVRIEALAVDPRPSGCEKLAGRADLYRIRQGQFRVIYTVNDDIRAVDVIKIGHRREVYRRP